MKVVLNKDVPNLGKKHEVKNVKRGYFMNYLLPRELCVVATEGRIQASKNIMELKRKKFLKTEEKIQEMKAKLTDLIVNFKKKTSKQNRLFDSIAEKDVLEAIEKKTGIVLKKEQISLKSHIKTLGEFLVPIHLNENNVLEIKVIVEEEK